MNAITAGAVLSLLTRARQAIAELEGATAPDTPATERPHAPLVNELGQVEELLRREIGASHMGTGADVVVIAPNPDNYDGPDDGEAWAGGFARNH